MTPRKILKTGVLFSALCFASNVLAFPCFITIAKDTCWKEYNVTVDVIDAETDRILLTVDVPKGVPWGRKSFESHPKQRLMLRARFSPVFWVGEEGKAYYATRYWSLPKSVVGEETTAWHIGVCFPQNFSSVPLPPDAGANCHCDTRELPPVKP